MNSYYDIVENTLSGRLATFDAAEFEAANTFFRRVNPEHKHVADYKDIILRVQSKERLFVRVAIGLEDFEYLETIPRSRLEFALADALRINSRNSALFLLKKLQSPYDYYASQMIYGKSWSTVDHPQVRMLAVSIDLEVHPHPDLARMRNIYQSFVEDWRESKYSYRERSFWSRWAPILDALIPLGVMRYIEDAIFEYPKDEFYAMLQKHGYRVSRGAIAAEGWYTIRVDMEIHHRLHAFGLISDDDLRYLSALNLAHRAEKILKHPLTPITRFTQEELVTSLQKANSYFFSIIYNAMIQADVDNFNQRALETVQIGYDVLIDCRANKTVRILERMLEREEDVDRDELLKGMQARREEEWFVNRIMRAFE